MSNLEDTISALHELAKEVSFDNRPDWAFKLYHESYLLAKNNPSEVRLSYRLKSLLGMSDSTARLGEIEKARAILSEGINGYLQELEEMES